MRSPTSDKSATRVVDDEKSPKLLRRKVRLEVIHGPDAGKRLEVGKEEINVGTLPTNDLVLADSAVSRYHLRINAGMQGFVVSDHDSTNGTFIGSLRVREVTIVEAVEVTLGSTVLRLTPLSDEVEVPLHDSDRFGSLLGRSPQMRAVFAQLEAVAGSNATILIEGETGTGKELFAEEIHKASPRSKEPFVIVDCGAIPDTLIESELFGHVRGAFTGAGSDRTGAFELAGAGTVFLDEIGEMSAGAQPKLLRALESRQVKPVGSDRYRSTNARIIAATNRDLRRAVNEGSFRSDLFYRLSVVRLFIAPLRDRPEDIELLAREFLADFTRELAPGGATPAVSKETLQRLMSHRWPGNVRELRNFMERVAVLAHSKTSAKLDPDPAPAPTEEGGAAAIPVELPYKEAKACWIDRFEIAYVTQLLQRNNNNVAAAARDAGVDRTYLFRLIRKYKLRD